MSKKILFVFVLLLVVSFGATAFASLTFTTDAITGTSASTIDLGSGNNLFLQTSGGSVGIGTTNPNKTLDVMGDIKFGDGINSSAIFPRFGGLWIRTEDGDGFQPALVFQDLTYASKAVGFNFITNGVTSGTRIEIADSTNTPFVSFVENGNVGIGTTTPGSKLSIVGLPAYVNNAAALAGGLVAGDLYYTDTAGEYVVKITHNPTP